MMAIQSFFNHSPNIHPTAFVHPTAVIIGRVTIEADCSIWPFAVIRGDIEPIHIRRGTNIQDHVVIHTSTGAPVEIGEYVTIGHQAIIHGATIHEKVLIGMGCLLLDHSIVHKHSIIGAKAMITSRKIIHERSMMLGSPATLVREVTQQEIFQIKENADHYIRLRKQYQE